MKKLFIIIMIFIIVFPLAACMNNNNISDNADTSQEIDSSTENIEDNSKDVYVTLPAVFYNGMTVNEIMAKKGKDGIKDIELHDDGSVTMTMSENTYNNSLKEMKESLFLTMDMMEDKTYPSIWEIEYDDELQNYSLIVNKDEYDGGYDNIATTVIGITAQLYQLFQGKSYSEAIISFSLVDEANGEIYSTINYP